MWPRSVQHGACMTLDDMDRIRKFVNEFCTSALLPYIENYIHQLNDIVSSISYELFDLNFLIKN